MKIFSKHRRKLEPYRRFGGREFQDKLYAAKNYKRGGIKEPKKNLSAELFSRTGLSAAAVYVLVAIVAVIFYFLVISPYFLVTNITVNGTKLVSADEIKNVISDAGKQRFLLVKENNFFLLNSGSVNKMIVSANPLVRETKSVRSWPNKLSIQVSERVPALTLTESNRNYLVDDQGYVVKEVTDSGNLLSVLDQVGEDIKVGEVIDGKIIPFIISMNQLWPTKMTQSITEVKIPGKGASEVEFVSSEGWSVFFTTDRPVTSQMNNLLAMLKQLIGNQRPNLAYIDLRLSKWAYYCYKATPCQQTDQSGLTQQSQPTPGTAGSVNQANQPASNTQSK